jgi:hypothetical protein
VDRSLYEGTRPYQGELIRCQSNHGDYACSRGEADVLGGNGMSLITRVTVARSSWVTDVTSGPIWH